MSKQELRNKVYTINECVEHEIVNDTATFGWLMKMSILSTWTKIRMVFANE